MNAIQYTPLPQQFFNLKTQELIALINPNLNIKYILFYEKDICCIDI